MEYQNITQVSKNMGTAATLNNRKNIITKFVVIFLF